MASSLMKYFKIGSMRDAFSRANVAYSGWDIDESAWDSAKMGWIYPRSNERRRNIGDNKGWIRESKIDSLESSCFICGIATEI